MTKAFYYRVHHLILQSSIPLPELTPCRSRKADVVFQEGAVPVHLPDAEGEKQGQLFGGYQQYEYHDDQFLLTIRDVGRFLIRDGRTITGERAGDVSDDTFRLFLLASGFAYLLQLRGLFPLHASAVDLGDECVLFTGECGAGKSTTAAQFLRAGYQLLSDDVCVVTFDPAGIPVVHPSFPSMKLWADSAGWLDYDAGRLPRVLPDYNKYRVDIAGHFSREPKPIAAFYSLQPADQLEVSMHPLHGMDKIRVLLESGYRKHGLTLFDREADHFAFCSRLAERIPRIGLLRRPRSAENVVPVVAAVEADLLHHPVKAAS